MVVHFKEVGQGDSIIIEWDEDSRKIGIIDCNAKKDSSNPILNFVIDNDLREIEFMILSHPHMDHLSGFNQLLDYCETQNIKIKIFIHTCHQVPECLKTSVNGHIAHSTLDKLFTNIQRLYDNKVIEKVRFADNDTQHLSLNANWKLAFLAPTYDEFLEFNKAKYYPDLSIKINTSIANMLCSLIKLYTDEKHVILSSDVTKRVFQREADNKLMNFKTQLCLGQIPHHGAKENFHNYFWKKQCSAPRTHSAISVGINSYNHPSPLVLKNLTDFDYQVNLTTINKSPSNKTKVSADLDIIAKPIKKSSIIKQDLRFNLAN